MPSSPEPVTRASFRGRLKRLSQPQPMTLLPTRTWTDEEWAVIQLGHRARDMEERWHVLTEEQTVFVHRSWTGRGIYEVKFVPADGGWRIDAAVVETDPAHYRGAGAEHERAALESVLGLLLAAPEQEEGPTGLWGRLVARTRALGTGPR